MASEDLNEKILKQVEFYFGDSNFPKDKFLRAQAAQDENGYVSLELIMSFSRMKQFTTDAQQVAQILRSSALLDVSEDGTKIKRKLPLPGADTANAKTAYTKGWPTDLTFDDIEKAVASLGKVVCVRVRKNLDKTSKGSAFIEFESEDVAKSFIEKGKFQYKDKEIEIKSKQEWFLAKKERKKSNKQEKKKRKAPDSEETGAEKKIKLEDGTVAEVKAEKEEEKEEEKGVIIEVKNIGPDVTREILRSVFEKYGKCAFVEYKKTEPTGFIRMDNAEGAQKAVAEITSNNVKIGDSVPSLRILAGDEETAYWAKIKEYKNSKSKRGGRGGKRGGRGGGRGGKRKRF